MKSIQIKSNNESDDQISDLQYSILVQELMTPDMVSKCSANDASFSGKRKHLAQNVIEKIMRIIQEMLMDISFLLMSYIVC